MNKQEEKMHKSMKDKHLSYPKLPRFILRNKRPNKGLMSSCLRGFYKRLSNWEADFEKNHVI